MTDDNERMLGLVDKLLDDSKKVAVDERVWLAMRRILARMMVSWNHCAREARLIVDSCRHADDCKAVSDPGRTCSPRCPDRERYLSARVVLASAVEFTSHLRLPSWSVTGYIPPTREYFDRILARLEALEAARDWLGELAAAGPKIPGEALEAVGEAVPEAQTPLSRLLPDPAYPAPSAAQRETTDREQDGFDEEEEEDT